MPAQGMAHLLGIDLGTTTTIVARIDASGAPEVVRDWDGQEVTPTAVAFESAAAVVVGREARAMAERLPDTRGQIVKAALEARAKAVAP